jgi:hypothetical protein
VIRIACTALTRRIMAGRVTKDNLSFTGDPQDVTSDCLKAVVEFIGVGYEGVVAIDGKPVYEITVKAIEESK